VSVCASLCLCLLFPRPPPLCPVVEFLLSKGARTDIKDNDGGAPLHNAAAKGLCVVCLCACSCVHVCTCDCVDCKPMSQAISRWSSCCSPLAPIRSSTTRTARRCVACWMWCTVGCDHTPHCVRALITRSRSAAALRRVRRQRGAHEAPAQVDQAQRDVGRSEQSVCMCVRVRVCEITPTRRHARRTRRCITRPSTGTRRCASCSSARARR
jgi:hypothetical protein